MASSTRWWRIPTWSPSIQSDDVNTNVQLWWPWNSLTNSFVVVQLYCEIIIFKFSIYSAVLNELFCILHLITSLKSSPSMTLSFDIYLEMVSILALGVLIWMLTKNCTLWSWMASAVPDEPFPLYRHVGYEGFLVHIDVTYVAQLDGFWYVDTVEAVSLSNFTAGLCISHPCKMRKKYCWVQNLRFCVPFTRPVGFY